ncbi:MAG: Xaa-Pro aminopeptidase [Bacteroidetes bacterium 4572_128]|nr:MAG: Xaa-Pro aminopeptidase [Bacteroidetes bacterium 4572_128]
MFDSNIYQKRRINLRNQLNSGLILFLSNQEASLNYKANTYRYRQDSNFSYFFGLDTPQFNAMIDIDSGLNYISGIFPEIDDLIWLGSEEAKKTEVAVKESAVDKGITPSEFEEIIKQAIIDGRKVHFLPPYRADQYLQLQNLLGLNVSDIDNYVSVELIEAIVKMRSVKTELEISEMEKAANIAYEMHTTAMKMAKDGVSEQKIVGKMEGIAISNGWGTSFPIILSKDGQYLHNHFHGNILKNGDLLLVDAGAETNSHYASDMTRTFPVSGKFSVRQKEIYEIVLKANEETIKEVKPGIFFKDLHLMAAKIIVEGLKEVGIMKGDTDEALEKGAHALFFPHGLGHQLGMDVHDMEGLGEKYVGYNKNVKRSKQFGLAFLRFAKNLKKGYVITIEPGIYFIPLMIDIWKKENKFSEFINYEKVETYKDFGGIRIEDDILVTENSYKILGKKVPKKVEEIEKFISENN